MQNSNLKTYQVKYIPFVYYHLINWIRSMSFSVFTAISLHHITSMLICTKYGHAHLSLAILMLPQIRNFQRKLITSDCFIAAYLHQRKHNSLYYTCF